MATKPSLFLKLGKHELNLRYDMSSILLLDSRGINLYDPNSYSEFNPNKLRDLVWAGQLHEKDPLSITEVSKLLPTKLSEYGNIAGVVANAIREALYPDKEE